MPHHRLEREWIGKRVRVSKWACGCDRNREGVVIPKRELPLTDRGIPNIPGYYVQMRADELAIKDNDGKLFIASIHYLERLAE